MKIKVFAIAVFVCLMGINSALAQTNDKVPSQSGVVIGPDDGITIVVLDSEEISKVWHVSSTGDLNLPLVGRIHAAGLTSEQLEQQLSAALKRYIRDPQVTVFISEFRSQPVTVAGAVDRPGTFQTEGPKTLLTVLMMAGGLKEAGPTLTVTREMKNGAIPLRGAHADPTGDYSTVELNVVDVMDGSAPAANLVVKSNDVISVSMAEQKRLVYIIGQVTRPGSVELVTHDSVSIMQVLAAAGGLTSVAAPGSTEIMHADSKGLYQKVASIDLKKVMSGKVPDRLLLAGDIIVVPSSNLKMYSQTATASAINTGLLVLTRF